MHPYPETNTRRLGILTMAGWLTGTLRVPRLHTLVDFIDTSHDFLKLSDVHLIEHDQRLPFLALQRSAAMFIAPLDDQPRKDTLPRSPETTEREVACLFDHCILVGKLDVFKGTRVSDYLMHRGGFIPVRECTLRGGGYLPPEARGTFELALVNRSRILGVSEPAGELLQEFHMITPRERLRAMPARYHDV
jgi:hypothetical protein